MKGSETHLLLPLICPSILHVVQCTLFISSVSLKLRTHSVRVEVGKGIKAAGRARGTIRCLRQWERGNVSQCVWFGEYAAWSDHDF